MIQVGRKRRELRTKNEERFSSTETDNSSPESEMLQSFSVAETKNLIIVFKSFFGRLCLANKDPVEIAAAGTTPDITVNNGEYYHIS